MLMIKAGLYVLLNINTFIFPMNTVAPNATVPVAKKKNFLPSWCEDPSNPTKLIKQLKKACHDPLAIQSQYSL